MWVFFFFLIKAPQKARRRRESSNRVTRERIKAASVLSFSSLLVSARVVAQKENQVGVPDINLSYKE